MSNNFFNDFIKHMSDPLALAHATINTALEFANNNKENSEVKEIYADIKRITDVCTLSINFEKTTTYVQLNVEITSKYPEIIEDNKDIFIPVDINILELRSELENKLYLLAIAKALDIKMRTLTNPKKKLIKAVTKETVKHIGTSLVQASFDKLGK